jgi:hypothetical protein
VSSALTLESDPALSSAQVISQKSYFLNLNRLLGIAGLIAPGCRSTERSFKDERKAGRKYEEENSLILPYLR